MRVSVRAILKHLQKAVMISHRNVIANTMQYCTYESVARKQQGVETQVELGLLPFSHIYGLVVIAHGGAWRGDEVVVLPKFEFPTFLAAIERFRLEQLYLVRRTHCEHLAITDLERCRRSSFE